MYLIVGLGNPGSQYASTRHNVGFMSLDSLAKAHGWQFNQRRARAQIATGLLDSRKVMLAKPQTFMNLSGLSVAEIVRYYRIPVERLLVLYDDMDLPEGKLRLRECGSSGGHKGMQSIINSLHTQDIPRIRIGIGRPEREPPESYVLRPFSADQQPLIIAAIEQAVEAIEVVVTQGITVAMNRFNSL